MIKLYFLGELRNTNQILRSVPRCLEPTMLPKTSTMNQIIMLCGKISRLN